MSYVVPFQCYCREQFDYQSTDGILTDECGTSTSNCVKCLSTSPPNDVLPLEPNEMEILNNGEIIQQTIHVPTIGQNDRATGCSNPKEIRILEDVIIKPSNVVGFEYPRLKEAAKFKYPSHITRQLVDGKPVFECTICRKTFRSKSNRNYHLYCDDSVEKPFNCKKCPKTFATKNHLEYHENRHDNVQYKCGECDRVFLSRASLQKHAKVHTNDFQYVCDHCDRKFHVKSDLILHMYNHKISPLPFQCDECEKSFSAKFKLNQHMMTHQGVKSHTCQFCGKKFTRNSSLTIHLLIHSSMDTKYECNVCSKTFDRQRSHDRHMKIKHGSTVFQCPLCDVQSGRKDNILRHIRNLHSAEKFEKIMKKISKTVARITLPEAVEQSVIVSNVDAIKETEAVSSVSANNETEATQTTNVCQYQSVIRFVGRSATPVSAPPHQEIVECPEIPIPVRLKTPTPIQIVVNDEPKEINTATNVLPIGNDDKIQSNPLNKELQVELAEPTCSGQTFSNFNIYRQLLSPYLRPPPNLDYRNGAPEKRRGYQDQGDRLPKRKENVEIYRSILMSSDDQPQQPQASVIQKNCTNAAEENGKSSNINPTSIVIHGQSGEYFSEMHWRKRTSQCFIRMD